MSSWHELELSSNDAHHLKQGVEMSFWQILGKWAYSDSGESIQKVSDTTSISSDGTVYNRMGNTTVGSDGSVFTQVGSFSSDGSTRIGTTATGLGAVFNKDPEDRF
jgi:hypothetical protein